MEPKDRRAQTQLYNRRHLRDGEQLRSIASRIVDRSERKHRSKPVRAFRDQQRQRSACAVSAKIDPIRIDMRLLTQNLRRRDHVIDLAVKRLSLARVIMSAP